MYTYIYTHIHITICNTHIDLDIAMYMSTCTCMHTRILCTRTIESASLASSWGQALSNSRLGNAKEQSCRASSAVWKHSRELSSDLDSKQYLGRLPCWGIAVWCYGRLFRGLENLRPLHQGPSLWRSPVRCQNNEEY